MVSYENYPVFEHCDKVWGKVKLELHIFLTSAADYGEWSVSRIDVPFDIYNFESGFRQRMSVRSRGPTSRGLHFNVA
jgi:hypothetical protein